jgi:hypothetical protein
MINVDGLDGEVFHRIWKMAYLTSAGGPDPSEEGAAQPEDVDPGLEDAGRHEREYVRERLREETGREPTREEVDEWLRQHTEGY